MAAKPESKWKPRCFTHPAVVETLDVQSLGAAFAAAWTLENHAKTEPLRRAGYLLPDTTPGNEVPLDHLAAMVDFVADNIELAAAEAIKGARIAARVGAAPDYPPDEVITGLTNFVVAARQWLANATTVGGPAVVIEGPEPDIKDPTMPAAVDFA